ncbi:hypothetical protein D0U04_28090 [Bacillus clarus]|uniref:Uncharacterized protein n=1 Tax=Bacillus clarus TaxID=2338372 RepID=A0A090Y9U2_9BACI|nr:hypothetical protein [Bacillus clarus]KFM95543.1 hypothetical protein DJ93_5440 [Bacillus clarus]RFT62410.1 hypothetical protein D0U04_28090 [Bacillus clarus]
MSLTLDKKIVLKDILEQARAARTKLREIERAQIDLILIVTLGLAGRIPIDQALILITLQVAFIEGLRNELADILANLQTDLILLKSFT